MGEEASWLTGRGDLSKLHLTVAGSTAGSLRRRLGAGGTTIEVEKFDPRVGVVAFVYVAGDGALAFLLCAGSRCLGLFFSLRARMAAELLSRIYRKLLSFLSWAGLCEAAAWGVVLSLSFLTLAYPTS